MGHEFKKLIKPNVGIGYDKELEDAMKSLALFYNPCIMQEYSERLLEKTELLSVFNLCMKTGNMAFAKAYSSLVSVALKGRSAFKRVHIQHFGGTAASHDNSVKFYRLLNNNHVNFIAALSQHVKINGKDLGERVNNIVSLISEDIKAGIVYDTVNTCLSIMHLDYEAITDEIESFLVSNDDMVDDSCNPDIQLNRYEKLCNLIEGNASIMHLLGDEKFYDVYKGDDPLSRFLSTHWPAISYSAWLATDMQWHLHKGTSAMDDLVNKLDECNVYVNDDGTSLVPHNKIVELRECIKLTRIWVAEAIKKRMEWASIVGGSGRFSAIPVLNRGTDDDGFDIVTERVRFMHNELVGLLKGVLQAIPSIHGSLDGMGKMDILKIVTDAINNMIIFNTKGSETGGFTSSGYVRVNEDLYIRGWETELYRALQEVMREATDNVISVDTYFNIKHYKNVNEN